MLNSINAGILRFAHHDIVRGLFQHPARSAFKAGTPITCRFLLAGLVGGMLAAGCSRLAVPPEPPPPSGVVDLDEQGWQDIRTRNQGRVLLVNFWATWCDPCREEFPGIVRLHQNYRARGLSVVAISMDEPESVPAIEKFLKAQGGQFGSYRHHFHDFSLLVDSINTRWGGGIPATFLYDPQGQLVRSWEGATSYAEFEGAVLPLLPRERLRFWPVSFR